MKKSQIFLLIGAGAVLILVVLVFGWWTRANTASPRVRTTFGGYTDNSSINGFGLLTQLLRQRGHTVSRTSLLTQQIDKYDAILWTHQGQALPQEKALDVLEKWMARGKRVVFLGSNYDATLDYWRDVYENSTGPERSVARWIYRRHQAETLRTAYQSAADFDVWSGNFPEESRNRWMSAPVAKETTFGYWEAATPDGPWRQTNDSQSSNLSPIVVKRWMQPGPEMRDVDVLAHVAGVETQEDGTTRPVKRPVMWVQRSSGGRNKAVRDLWVISSPIFLNNYGIVKPENAKMRDEFLSSLSGHHRILFLETGPGKVMLSTTPDDRIDRPWRWMTHHPFPLFALHAVLLAVVYCFAKFPVFGRAKRVDFAPRNDFGQHIKEVGRLLRQHKRIDFARERIQHYFQVVRRGHRSSGNPRDSKVN